VDDGLIPDTHGYNKHALSCAVCINVQTKWKHKHNRVSNHSTLTSTWYNQNYVCFIIFLAVRMTYINQRRGTEKIDWYVITS